MIIASLSSCNTEHSISGLSKELGIPIVIIREDLQRMFANQVLQNTLTFDDFEDIETVQKKILDGSKDYEEIYFNAAQIGIPSNSQNIIPVPLTEMEVTAVMDLFPTLFKNSYGTVYQKKTYANPLPYKNLNIIQSAIFENSGISFFYVNRNEEVSLAKCMPKLIRMRSDDNTAYCIAENGIIFKINRMRNIKKIKAFKMESDKLFQDDFEHLWSVPDGDNTLYHVVCRIEANTRNIIDKIKADLKRRENTCTFSQREDGYYYYEDDLIGLSSFSSWVRSYGFSMVVLEPRFLAEKLYQDALINLQQLETYEFVE